MAKLQFQAPKGTKDILPEEQQYWRTTTAVMERIVSLYGFERLDLPVFEESALFERGVGEGTDIVEKEMYTFKDRGDTLLTLRPEFTAGTMRSYLENGMASLPKPVRVWSMGPVFRYERPQAGRFRQHTQLNVEALGEEDPALDLEVMSVAWHVFQDLGFQNLAFQLNSIGCPECRPHYTAALISYYEGKQSVICEDCRKRMKKNPMRLLDCKQEQCQPVIEKAPFIRDFLGKECKEHFETLLGYLDDLGRPYNLNPRLVRGLDYYTKTVFEVWAQGIGAQNAVCGGGRYDKLAEILGGPPTPAVGFAAGMERIILTLKEEKIRVPSPAPTLFYLAGQGEEAKRQCVRLLSSLRGRNLRSMMGYGSRSLKAQLREANRIHAAFTVIVGEEEAGKKEMQVKDMKTGEQKSLKQEALEAFLSERGIG